MNKAAINIHIHKLSLAKFIQLMFSITLILLSVNQALWLGTEERKLDSTLALKNSLEWGENLGWWVETDK